MIGGTPLSRAISASLSMLHGSCDEETGGRRRAILTHRWARVVCDLGIILPARYQATLETEHTMHGSCGVRDLSQLQSEFECGTCSTCSHVV